MIPRISVSPEELKDGALRADTLHRAIQLFRVHGFLLLEDVFSERFVENLNDAYCSRYANYFGEKASSDALEVGDLRKMIRGSCREQKRAAPANKTTAAPEGNKTATPASDKI